MISLPAYDEVATLGATVRDALDAIARLGIDGSVRIIDDGSRDGTGAMADELAREHPEVSVLHHPMNLGFSGAIRSALATRTAEFVMLAPADGQVSLDVLPSFWEAREDADVVVGLRRPRADSLWRRFLSRGYHLLSRILLGVRVPEFTSVLMFRRSFLDGCEPRARARSAALLAELMYIATRDGARIRAVPFRHLPRAGGSAKGGSLGVVTMTAVELVLLAWRLRVRR